jgi:hypothetical protein
MMMAPRSLVLLCLLCIFYTQVPKVAAAASPTKILADNLKSEKLEEARGKLLATQGQLETLKAWPTAFVLNYSTQHHGYALTARNLHPSPPFPHTSSKN